MQYPRFRLHQEKAPEYGPNTDYFTVEVRHGGSFFDKPNNITYEHGSVLYMDYVHPTFLTSEMLNKFIKAWGSNKQMEVFYRKPEVSLGKGLYRINNEQDVKNMLKDRNEARVVEIYFVPPKQKQALPWDDSNPLLTEHVGRSDPSKEGCYVPVLEWRDEQNQEYNWDDRFFYANQDAIWSQVEDTMAYHSRTHDEQNIPTCDANNTSESHEERQSIEDEGVLLDSDYEMDEDFLDNAGTHPPRNMDFGFCVLNEPLVKDSDTDYGDSDELKSLDGNEEEEESTSRKRRRRQAFNPRTDMGDPLFIVGQTFESKKVLKDAITEHSVRHNREIKYLKDDAKRLRATCKQKCSWVLYATKQEDKWSFEIKTFRGVHSCSLVYRNRRVSSTYLAAKYASDFRAEPNMTCSGFMDRVKKDNLGDISVWQFYRTREKAMEKIRGSVVEHYKVLADYCHQLRLTNIGSTVQLEGRAGEFKRLYICLGGLKEGFLNGCRKVIGVDGCFLKTEYGGQLLTAVGIDGNNGMYPVAYAVVETENGENWRWFLALLLDDLGIHNSYGWTFMSDKQKGLVNAIGSLFEHAEHRTCVRHLYNNFSATHKGLALKNCLWDTARATTIPKWQEHMQKMLDLDPAAYGWLELKPASQWSKSHFQERTKCDMLLNNLCESFNSTLLHAREQPILTMLEEIRVYLMKRIVIRRESCEKWNGEVGPRIHKILNKNSRLARSEHADYSGNGKFQVRHNIGTLNVVDVRAKTCSCRAWQLTGIPCCHVIASLTSRGMSIIDYIDDIYKKETYIRTYTPSISPMTSPDLWPNPGLDPLKPPFYSKKAGRPKKARRKEVNEHEGRGSSTGNASRVGLKMKCKKCGQAGHNKRTCSGLPPPSAT